MPRLPTTALLVAASCMFCVLLASPARGQDTVLRDGEPLSFLQDPPILRPDHHGPFALRDLVVLGDFETVTFERADGTAPSGVAVETWTRLGTRWIHGRLASVFEPTWTEEVFADRLRYSRIGFDHPYMFLGRLVLPTAPHPKRSVYLRVGLTGIPQSVVRQPTRDVLLIGVE